MKKRIREFIVSSFLKGDRSISLDDDISFLENGMIDSVGVLELVAFLEVTFGFSVEDEELIPENLDSVNRLVTYSQSKLVSNNS